MKKLLLILLLLFSTIVYAQTPTTIPNYFVPMDGGNLISNTVDSTKIKSGAVSGTNFVNPLRIPALNSVVLGTYTSRVGTFVGKTAWIDTIMFGLYRGGQTTMLTSPSAGVLNLPDTVSASSYRATSAPTWALPVSDFTVIFSDSTSSSGVAIDTTMARTDWTQYYSVTTVNSPRLKTVILGKTFFPIVLNPDSLLFDAYCDTTASVADSAAIMVVIKSESGTIVSTGWATLTAPSRQWRHVSYVMPVATPFIKNKMYSCRVYMKAVSGGRWCFSPIRFR